MTRLVRSAVFGLLTLSAVAQGQADRDWAVRAIAGVALPTGAHRRAFGSATFLGAQTSLRITNTIDVVTAFAWQPSTGKYAVADNHADVLVYNVGLERVFRAQRPDDRSFAFAGAGVGGRAFDFSSSSLESTACFSAYGNVGAGYQRGRSSMRFEMRDNLFCYKQPIVGLDAETHNEVTFSLGFGVRF
jgi:hypothetical protein